MDLIAHQIEGRDALNRRLRQRGFNLIEAIVTLAVLILVVVALVALRPTLREIRLMRDTGLPSGIAALGYKEADVPALAEGAYAQQRPLVMAPRPVSQQDLEGIYRAAMRYW